MNDRCSHEDRFENHNEVGDALEELWLDPDKAIRAFTERCAGRLWGITGRDLLHDAYIKMVPAAHRGTLCRSCMPGYYCTVVRHAVIDAGRRCERQRTSVQDPADLSRTIDTGDPFNGPLGGRQEPDLQDSVALGVLEGEIRALAPAALRLLADVTRSSPRLTQVRWEALRRHAASLLAGTARNGLATGDQVNATRARRLLAPLLGDLLKSHGAHAAELDPSNVALLLRWWGLLDYSWPDLYAIAEDAAGPT